jgi:hypothetical protein
MPTTVALRKNKDDDDADIDEEDDDDDVTIVLLVVVVVVDAGVVVEWVRSESDNFRLSWSWTVVSLSSLSLCRVFVWLVLLFGAIATCRTEALAVVLATPGHSGVVRVDD